MDFEFIYNEYILIWNLLFRQSISKNLNDNKQKIWYNYKNEYNALFGDKELILKDPKNYIPNDDTIYNIVKELDLYPGLSKEVEHFRLTLIKKWNEVKKVANKNLKDLLRINLNTYKVYVVDPKLEVTDIVNVDKSKIIIYGSTSENLIMNLVYKILFSELESASNSNMVNACLELILKNEIPTRISGVSHYLDGKSKYASLKKQIYPYFLMYMNVPKDKFYDYMKRDGIIFNVNSFPYNEALKNMNIFSFIDFCIKNVTQIIKIDDSEIL